MPTEAFQWVDYSEQRLQTSVDVDHGYILEVDLEYPASLHAEHNDYPLAPEKMAVDQRQDVPISTEAGRGSWIGCRILQLQKTGTKPDTKTAICPTLPQPAALPTTAHGDRQSPQSPGVPTISLDGPVHC